MVEAVRRAWGVVVRDGYGQTETTCLAGTSPGMSAPAGVVGKAMPGYRLTTTATDEIVVEMTEDPVGVTAGYLPDLRRPTRYWHTGDVGAVENGWLHVLGRVDDVFQSLRAPGLAAGAWRTRSLLTPRWRRSPSCRCRTGCVGWRRWPSSYPSRGRPWAPRLRHTLRAHVDDVVADALRPRDIVLAAALPRTLSGKVRRAAVRDWVAAGAPGPELAESHSEREELR
ncbi:AMP-binding protein [Nocardioides convexus]|uniref:AMP-binding protein n=1 Tax=Nocardioides convexus TaxID=2712224 RepID=UPI002418554D|nr:AMP-binding protein [Nocardioides convexus]